MVRLPFCFHKLACSRNQALNLIVFLCLDDYQAVPREGSVYPRTVKVLVELPQRFLPKSIASPTFYEK
jgi:hypothetical protein